MPDGIIILPISDEPDAQPADPAAAVRGLCDQLDRTGDQIRAAAVQSLQQISPQRLAALSDQMQQLAQRVQDATAAAEQDGSGEEPARTELDSLRAEFAALQRVFAAEEAERRAAELAALPTLDSLPQMRKGMPLPVDKVTRGIFKPAADGGQRYGEYTIRRSKTDAKSPILAILGFSATKDSIERLEALTGFDNLVLLAIGGLCENGVNGFSYSQLWRAMGNRGEIGGYDRSRIKRSLQKLAKCRIYLKQTAFDFSIETDFALLEYRATTVKYHGQKAGFISILARPAWLEIADAQNQLTKVSFDVYADGDALTDQGAALSIYLVREIAHMRNQRTFPREMRLDTIAAAAGVNITHRESKRRLCKRIEAKLTHYATMKNPFIKGFVKYENGYKIKLP